MPNDLKVSAELAGCDFNFEFSQVEFLNNHPDIAGEIAGSSGICYGYAFVWLEYWANNINPKAHIEDRTLGEKAKDIYLMQSDIRLGNKNFLAEAAAKHCGAFEPAVDGEDFPKQKNLNIFNKSELKKLVDWLTASRKTRFFTIHAQAHTMAACGSANGKLRFFDPNFGAISTYNASHLGKCLYKFFSTARVQGAYWPSIKAGQITVRKYK